MDISTLSGEALTAALALDTEKASDAMLASALVPRKEAATTLFAVENPTAEQADAAEAIVASIGTIESEIEARAAKVAETASKFAAAKAKFAEQTAEPVVEQNDEADDADESDESDEDDADESDEADEADTTEAEGGETVEAATKDDESETDEKKAMTASGTKPSAAKKIGARAKRPAAPVTSKVKITAGADITGFATGQSLDGMEQVTKALLNRAKGFPAHSVSAAQSLRDSGVDYSPSNKFGVASFGMDFDEALVASAKGNPGADYAAIQASIKARQGDGETLTAAGWCAPSETIYSFVADYVVDGLLSLPEVSAPRGGINITTGPRVGGESQGQTNLDNFGWTQTEAQAEAGTVKPFESIVCPDFEDHRLDAIGYAFKIPLLTQKAYPEIVTDALRFANVLYAHKVNRRLINDIVALSDARTFSGYGASFTDSLEALSILAVKERRKWNLGENAVMEVKAPVWAREVFRADMSRRTGLALNDIATDQKIDAEFTARRLSVEYVADWQELTGTNIVLNPSFDFLVYPAGTFVKAVEDVVNLSAIYDAASLSVNEYTGVFFEQGILTAKVGYGSSKITIPVNTAGETGAAIMTGLGDSTAAGSF